MSSSTLTVSPRAGVGFPVEAVLTRAGLVIPTLIAFFDGVRNLLRLGTLSLQRKDQPQRSSSKVAKRNNGNYLDAEGIVFELYVGCIVALLFLQARNVEIEFRKKIQYL